MKLKTKLVAVAMLAGSASIAQATTYNVAADFADGGMQSKTLFDGSFDWDGTTVTNFTGMLSQAMWGWTSSNGQFDSNGTNPGGMKSIGTGMMGTTAGVDYSDKVYAKPGGYVDNEAPLLELTHQVNESAAAGKVSTSVFLNAADTDMYIGGGYAVGDDTAYGWDFAANSQTAATNTNAYFTLVFDEMDPTDTSSTMLEMVYGDCTALGLMSGMLTGDLCMTGHQFGGSMGASITSLSITEVSAVPVPAAAWLFGGALASLFGASRRKRVLPA